MTTEQFNEFIHEVIPQQLFHVEPTDIDDDSGAQLDEVILVGLIANRPSCLKHKPLQWFLDTFLIKTERSSEEDLFRQIQKDEREGESCPSCMGSGERVFGGSFGGATHHQPCIRCNGTGRIKE